MAGFQTTRYPYCVAMVLGATVLAGPQKEAPKKETATVFLAASLGDVVKELAEDFERETGVALTLNAGASGALRKQIELDAPADLFISADTAQIDALQKEGRIASGSRRVLAQNRLVIALPKAVEADSNLPGSLREPRYKRIAIAEPESAPAGRYAKQALEAAGIWNDLKDKLVIADDVRAAAKYAELETVDAAIVYQTDAAANPKLQVAYTFPSNSHDPCLYVAGVIANRPPSAASKFLDYIASPAAQAVWRKHGFDLPPTLAEQKP